MHISEVRNPQLSKADRPKEGADANDRGVAAMLDRFPWLTCGRKSAPLAEDRSLFQDGFQTSTPLGSDSSM